MSDLSYSVELLQQETYKMLGYERNYIKQQQLKQQFIMKRVMILSHCIVLLYGRSRKKRI